VLIALFFYAPAFGAPAPTLELTKTVGKDLENCAPSNDLTVGPNTQVHYCYKLTNTGKVTLTKHTLDDNVLGNIFADILIPVPPGGMVTHIVTTTVGSDDVINEGKWTAMAGFCCDTNCSGEGCASDTDCFDPATCRFDVGICCDPNDPDNCFEGFDGQAVPCVTDAVCQVDTGACSLSNDSCTSNSQCNGCGNTGRTCGSDADCLTCNVTGISCTDAGDCGTCSDNGDPCNTATDCGVCNMSGTRCSGSALDCPGGEFCTFTAMCDVSGEACVASGDTCDSCETGFFSDCSPLDDNMPMDTSEATVQIDPDMTTLPTLLRPRVGLMKTVTRESGGVCGANSVITANANEEVIYCYKLTNTGVITVATHTFEDDVLGTMNELQIVPPGGMLTKLVTVTTGTDMVTNTAMVTSQPAGKCCSDIECTNQGNPNCTTNAECDPNEFCRTDDLGVCCEDATAQSCDMAVPVLICGFDDDCTNGAFDTCVPFSMPAMSNKSSAKVNISTDNCPDVDNPGQENGDGDSHGDDCDNCPNDDNENQFDADNDGVGDVCDNCPDDFNPGQEDTDGDGVGDACNDADDADGDEFSDSLDNCPDDFNPGQEDTDGDGVGDACNDADDADGDEFSDSLDNCPDDFNPNQEDIDSDGIGNFCDAAPAPALSPRSLAIAFLLLLGFGLAGVRGLRVSR
jgi:hypothetical protein